MAITRSKLEMSTMRIMWSSHGNVETRGMVAAAEDVEVPGSAGARRGARGGDACRHVPRECGTSLAGHRRPTATCSKYNDDRYHSRQPGRQNVSPQKMSSGPRKSAIIHAAETAGRAAAFPPFFLSPATYLLQH